jgi:uncharacterized repeat protein (TIGR01451 family)
MNVKLIITAAAAIAALALPTAASAATNPCTAGIMNEVSVVPPATLAEGDTQAHHFTVSACTTVNHITTEWVRVIDSTQPYLLNASNRTTVIPETTINLNPQPNTTAPGGQIIHHYDGRDDWTIPTGQADGHYAVITRYYSTSPDAAEAQALSSFSLATPDVCDNIAGKQQTVPAGTQQQGTSCITPPPPPVDVCDNLPGAQSSVPAGYTQQGTSCIVPPLPPTPTPPTPTPPTPIIPTPPVITDLCTNLDGAQDAIPVGYTVVAGECKIIATPTGKTPTPLPPTPHITKTANVKTTTTGGIVRYTITTGNTGRGTMKDAVTCDKIPAGMTYVAASKGFAFAGNGSVCWKLGNLLPDAKRTMTLTLKVSASFHGKKLTNTACTTSSNAKTVCAKAIVKVKVIRREPVGGVTG